MARKAAPVDEWISELAIARLCAPDAAVLWTANKDVSALMAEADVLRRRKADLAEDYAVMTRDQFRAANEAVLSRLANVESEIAGAAGNSSLGKMSVAVDKRAAWNELSVAQRRNIIDTLMTIKLHPIGAGTRTFRPESVEVAPK